MGSDISERLSQPRPSASKRDRSIPMLPEDAPEGDWNMRTASEIEHDRLAAKGLPIPKRSADHGE